MKRQRGRGRKPGGGGNYSGGGGGHGNHPNRTLESNGPDIKIRGSASHLYEKYVQLSRDASTSGDRVLSESYAQYAEHYYRMLRAMQPQTPVYEPQRFGQDLDYENEEGGEEGEGAEGEGGENAEGGEGQPQQYAQREQRQPYQGDRQGGENRNGGQYRDRQDRPYNNNYRADRNRDGDRDRGPRPERTEQPRVEAVEQPVEGEPQPIAAVEESGGEDRGNRRRRGRGRYRAGEDRGPRAEGEGGEAGPVEGFGDTVPAFVGNE
jgi:hypothetical protein